MAPVQSPSCVVCGQFTMKWKQCGKRWSKHQGFCATQQRSISAIINKVKHTSFAWAPGSKDQAMKFTSPRSLLFDFQRRDVVVEESSKSRTKSPSVKFTTHQKTHGSTELESYQRKNPISSTNTSRLRTPPCRTQLALLATLPAVLL